MASSGEQTIGIEKDYQEEDDGWGDEKQPVVLTPLHQTHRPPSGEKPSITHVLRQDGLRYTTAPAILCQGGGYMIRRKRAP